MASKYLDLVFSQTNGYGSRRACEERGRHDRASTYVKVIT